LEQGKLKLYRRLGNMPDVVTGISEGTGRKLTIAYTPSSNIAIHTPDVQTCLLDPDHLACLTGGPLLVSSLSEQGGSVNITQSFTYSGGIYDRGGRGFLGFERRDIIGPGSNWVIRRFNNAAHFALGTSGAYAYSGAFHPSQIMTLADTPLALSNIHH